MRVEMDTLTRDSVPAVKTRMESAVRAGDAELDLSAVRTADSSAAALVLAWRRRVLAAGLTPRITGMPEKLAALLSLYGLDSLLI